MNTKPVKTKLLNYARAGLFRNDFMEHALRRVTRGRPTTDWLCRLVPNYDQYAPASLRKVEEPGRRLELDLSDSMEWHLFYDFLDPSAENLAALCAPGDVVFDIGANIGAMLMKIVGKVGPQGSVTGFEPDPGRYEKCRRHLQLNGVTRATVHPVAFGNVNGQKKLRVRDEKNQGMNQIVPESHSDQLGVAIDVCRVDDFIDENRITRLDLIKIDVEGYEFEVLKGAAETLRRFKPKLFVEVDDVNLSTHGAAPEEIFNYLRNFGYSLYENTRAQPLAATGGQSFRSRHFDLVAL